MGGQRAVFQVTDPEKLLTSTERKTQNSEQEINMTQAKGPKHYQQLTDRFPEVLSAVENLGSAIRSAGPLDKKTAELIGLGVAAAAQSTGAVQSHARRALAAGASREEVEHALLLLISTIGFPKVAAALAWAEETLKKNEE